jgi:hypothetical protein
MKDMSQSLSLFFDVVHFITDLNIDRAGDFGDFDFEDFLDGLGEGDRRDNVFLREGDIFFTFFALFLTFLTFFTFFTFVVLFVIFLHLPDFGLRLFPVGQSLTHLMVSKFRTLPFTHFWIHRPVFGLFSFPDGHDIFIY